MGEELPVSPSDSLTKRCNPYRGTPPSLSCKPISPTNHRAALNVALLPCLVDQVDEYILPSRRSGAAVVTAADTGRHYAMKSVAIESVIGVVDANGNGVGELAGVTMNLYASDED